MLCCALVDNVWKLHWCYKRQGPFTVLADSPRAACLKPKLCFLRCRARCLPRCQTAGRAPACPVEPLPAEASPCSLGGSMCLCMCLCAAPPGASTVPDPETGGVEPLAGEAAHPDDYRLLLEAIQLYFTAAPVEDEELDGMNEEDREILAMIGGMLQDELEGGQGEQCGGDADDDGMDENDQGLLAIIDGYLQHKLRGAVLAPYYPGSGEVGMMLRPAGLGWVRASGRPGRWNWGSVVCSIWIETLKMHDRVDVRPLAHPPIWSWAWFCPGLLARAASREPVASSPHRKSRVDPGVQVLLHKQ